MSPRVYRQTGKLLEKYDVIATRSARRRRRVSDAGRFWLDERGDAQVHVALSRGRGSRQRRGVRTRARRVNLLRGTSAGNCRRPGPGAARLVRSGDGAFFLLLEFPRLIWRRGITCARQNRRVDDDAMGLLAQFGGGLAHDVRNLHKLFDQWTGPAPDHADGSRRLRIGEPRAPRPSTAVPSVTMATIWLLQV